MPRETVRMSVERQLAEIKRLAASGDAEAAHGAEDALHIYVLSAVAKSPPLVRRRDGEDTDIVALAKLALASSKIGFGRFCA